MSFTSRLLALGLLFSGLGSVSGTAKELSTPAASLKVAKGFQVELLYSVPKETEGSWVNLCSDPKGRLYVSDQYGPIYRVTPSKVGEKVTAPKLEKVQVDIGEAQGLLWAFDSLYVVVNGQGKYKSGLYRLKDTNNDDQLDKLETLRLIDAKGEHGTHAILLGPDKKSLYLVAGNGGKLTELDKSRVPTHWGEDHLLPRLPDGRGFMKDVLGPGGNIYRTDPEGKSWELICTGFRNEYDAGFHRSGELITYDADMEWDMNTPWYRPTRVCHVVSGVDWGWRNGAGKWPVHYPDTLPPVVNIGPGSPTGVCFGYGAKFPTKYQEAFFICDWSYGKLYAVHLTPTGSTFTGALEDFISGTPLPLTDVIINPTDGAMYFTVGGRKTQSGLYRVTYVGSEATTPLTNTPDAGAPARAKRLALEAFHGKKDPQAVTAVWPALSDPDRFMRYAARVALEHQDPKLWEYKALNETDPQAGLSALLGYVRATGTDPLHRKSDTPVPDKTIQVQVFAALQKFEWAKLSDEQRLELLRIYAITCNRFGPPNAEQAKKLQARFEPLFPTTRNDINAELGQLLVYLQAPTAAKKLVKQLQAAPTQEEQLEYARSLRMLKAGWTPELRKSYFTWFVQAGGYRGGASFGLFVDHIKRDALLTLTDAEKLALKPILEAPPVTIVQPVAPRPIVKEWKFDELVKLTESGLTKRDYDRGRSLFGAASCFACHRYNNEGGAFGPDLTSVVGRFSVKDLLESIVLPNKVISDQYAASTFELKSGKVVTGRIINLRNDEYLVNTNMLDPNAMETVKVGQIEKMVAAKTSPMPDGLLNTLKEDEVLDLLAFLLSRGDRQHAMFQGKK